MRSSTYPPVSLGANDPHRASVLRLATAIAALMALHVCAPASMPQVGPGSAGLQSGTIVTVAGDGEFFVRDGGPATGAELASPRGVAVDTAGNLYIADSSSHRVRRVDPAGVITTVAGTGAPGYGGDSGPAVNARLGYPSAVALEFLVFDILERQETRAYDLQFREKSSPPAAWRTGCVGGVNPPTPREYDVNFRSFSLFVRNVPRGTHQVRYRHRNSSLCGTGTPGEWSEIGEEGVTRWPW